MRTLALVVALLGLSHPASAQVALGKYGRLRLQTAHTCPPAGFINVWCKTSDSTCYQTDSTCTDTPLGGGGGAGTFATIYSATSSDNLVPVDSTGGAVGFNRTDVATGQLASVNLENTTAATSGNQKYSPMLTLLGRGYETTGPSSGAFGWALQAQPVEDTAGRGDLAFYTKVGAGSWTKFLSFTYDPVSTVHRVKSNTSIVQFLNSANAGTSAQSNDMYLLTNASAIEYINQSHLGPYTDGQVSLGNDSKAWKFLQLTPISAPANPTTGNWRIYVDAGDGNKLKAKASTGTVVTLGTP